MADNYAARKQSGWQVVSIVPDVCKTPMGSSTPPVPYPVTSQLVQTDKPAGTVFANGNPLVLFDASLTAKTLGDAPGKAKGIKSNTVSAACWPKERSSTVRVEGKHTVRHDDQFWMNGNYSGKQTKAERWEARQALIEDGKENSDPDVQAAAQRFEKNNYAVERARLADHVYDPSQPVPEGWNNISNDPQQLARYGLNPSDMTMPDSNFQAQLYAPDPAVFGNDMQPTLAFQGTENWIGTDGSNNLAQGLNNNAPYYERAVEIGRTLKQNAGDVHIAGHSLGGGLASATSRTSGLPATTFNSAGLHPETVARYGGNPTSSHIDAYRVEGEILTHAQEAGFWEGGPLQAALGAAMPDAVGDPHTVSGEGMWRLPRHGMDQVIDGIEEQKEADQETLTEASRPGGASGSWGGSGTSGGW